MSRATKLFVFFYVFLAYAICTTFHPLGAGQSSRFAATKAIAFQQTFIMDEYKAESFDDWSSKDGHYYSNKAPGLHLLAAPIMRVVHSPVFVTILTTALPSALMVLVLLELVLLTSGSSAPSPRTQALLALILAFGTIGFAYSTTYLGHQTAAAALLGSYYAAKRSHYFWAGLLFGFGVLTEYTVGLALPLFLPIFWPHLRQRTTSPVLVYALGELLPLVVFCYYHYICFGNPLAIAPSFQNPGLGLDTSVKIFGVVGIPDLKILWELLFGFKRGLFILSPILLLGLYGLLRSPKDQSYVVLFVVAAFLIFNSSYNGWHGGDTIGTRYLLPAVPFLLLYIGHHNIHKAPLYIVGLLSIAINIAIVSVDILPMRGYDNVLTEKIFPRLIEEPRFMQRFIFLCIYVALGFEVLTRLTRRSTPAAPPVEPPVGRSRLLWSSRSSL